MKDHLLKNAERHIITTCLGKYEGEFFNVGADEQGVIDHINDHQQMADGREAVDSLIAGEVIERSEYLGRSVIIPGDAWDSKWESVANNHLATE